MAYSTFVKLFRSVVFNFSEGGVSQVARKILVRTAHLLYDHEEVYILECSAVGSTAPRVALTFRELTLQDLLECGYTKAHFFPEVIASRYAQNEQCLGFYDEGSLAHIAWLSPGYLRVSDGFPVLPIEDGIGFYDAITFPEHRGKGVYVAALLHVRAICASRGYSRILAAVAPTNPYSIKGLTKAGFRHVRTLSFRRLLIVFTSVRSYAQRADDVTQGRAARSDSR